MRPVVFMYACVPHSRGGFKPSLIWIRPATPISRPWKLGLAHQAFTPDGPMSSFRKHTLLHAHQDWADKGAPRQQPCSYRDCLASFHRSETSLGMVGFHTHHRRKRRLSHGFQAMTLPVLSHGFQAVTLHQNGLQGIERHGVQHRYIPKTTKHNNNNRSLTIQTTEVLAPITCPITVSYHTLYRSQGACRGQPRAHMPACSYARVPACPYARIPRVRMPACPHAYEAIISLRA